MQQEKNNLIVVAIILFITNGAMGSSESGMASFNDTIINRTEEFKKNHIFKENDHTEKRGFLITRDNNFPAFVAKYGEEFIHNCFKQTKFGADMALVKLAYNLLEEKKQNGSQIEKDFYKKMNLDSFFVRLLNNRPLMLVNGPGGKDFATLRDRSNPQGSYEGDYTNEGFDLIGTEKEHNFLPLSKYLSTDEVAISSLIPIASPTVFINSGGRFNGGMSNHERFQEKGYFVGLIGVRFERPYSEWNYMVITEKQNTEANGYGVNKCNNGLLKKWADFYDEKFPTFQEAKQDDKKYISIPGAQERYFNGSVYKKRIQFMMKKYIKNSIDNTDPNDKAHIRLPGIGLGPWAVNSEFLPQQTELYLEACFETLLSMDEQYLKNIADFEFIWFEHFDGIESCLKKTLGDANWGPIFGFMKVNTPVHMIGGEKIFTIKGHDIKISFSTKDVASPIEPGKKLIAAYAWDGNAFVGNEYWKGMIAASGDPAAVCCSMIGYTQNPLINPYLDENVREVVNLLTQQGKLEQGVVELEDKSLQLQAAQEAEKQKLLNAQQQEAQEMERKKAEEQLALQKQKEEIARKEAEEQLAIDQNKRLKEKQEKEEQLALQKQADGEVARKKAEEAKLEETQKLLNQRKQLEQLALQKQADKEAAKKEAEEAKLKKSSSWQQTLPFFMNSVPRALLTTTLASFLAYCIFHRDILPETMHQLWNSIPFSFSNMKMKLA